MLRFLVSRFVQSLVVLWAVYTVTFVLLMSSPGDPFVGEKKPPESVQRALAERYGLEYLKLPEAERAKLTVGERAGYIGRAYGLYLWRLGHLDLGPTISYENWTVNDVIVASLPVSVALGALALLIALWGGVLAGTLGAVHKGGAWDMGLSVVTLLGVSLPTFVTGSLLLMVLAVVWPVLPSSGWGTLGQLVLPAVTLALLFLAYIARLTRVSVLDVLSADYVRTARAKGLSQGRVIRRHVLANAGLPVLSFLGPAAATVLTGSFVVEKLFAIPGLGQHFVNGCLYNDIPLVLGSVMVYTVLIVGFNLLVDVAYAGMDPRITL